MITEKIHIREIIGSRFDNSYVLYQHKTSNYKYPVAPLYKFLEIKPQYGAGEAGVPRNDDTSPRYIRITDIDENGFLSNDLGVTANKVEEKYILNNNDILIARSGNTVGKSYIHKTNIIQDKCFYAGYLIRFVVDTEKILPDYVYILTKLSPYADWVKVTQRVTGQPNINAEEYSNLPIPVPPTDVQQDILKIYINAIERRRKKLLDAQHLLNGIDDYLINTLKINKYQSEARTSYVHLSSFIGDRFDAHFQIKIENAIKGINTIPNKPLGEIAEFSSENWNQKTIFRDVFPYIEISAIDTLTGEITDIENVPVNKTPSRAKKIVRKNDILISTTRPNRGAISIYANDEIAIASTGFSIIRNVDSSVSREYLLFILRSSLSLEQMEIRSSGGNYPSIIESELKKIIIPIPSLDIQNEIVNAVKNKKNRAKQLQTEGDALLENAKNEIEKLIIG